MDMNNEHSVGVYRAFYWEIPLSIYADSCCAQLAENDHSNSGSIYISSSDSLFLRALLSSTVSPAYYRKFTGETRKIR